MFWQPTKCKCLGGYCWGRFCFKKESAKDTRPNKKKKFKNKIRTWHPPQEGDDGRTDKQS